MDPTAPDASTRSQLEKGYRRVMQVFYKKRRRHYDKEPAGIQGIKGKGHIKEIPEILFETTEPIPTI